MPDALPRSASSLESALRIRNLQAERDRYRTALIRIAGLTPHEMRKVAREALGDDDGDHAAASPYQPDLSTSP